MVKKKVFVCVGPNTGDSEMQEIAKGHDVFLMFEPLPSAAKWLRDNNKNADDVFHVIEAACGQENGKSTLTVYNTKGVSSSLGFCTEQSRKLYSQVDWTPAEQIEVDVVHLGDFLSRHGVKEIETLLIDAQGMDVAILRTLENYLRASKIKRIIHEVDGDGYRMYDGLPDNSISAAVAFMDGIGNYNGQMLPNRNHWNFDIEWTLKSS